MTLTDPRAKLDALLSLVNSAAQEAIAEYDKAGNGLPTLDEPHLGDFEADSLGLRKALRILEGACDQLCSTLAKPGHTMINRALLHFEPACIHVAVETHIADILLDHPKGLHTRELSEKTGIENKKLGRILRFLATKHCFREVAPDVFTNNRLSRTLASDRFSPLLQLITHESRAGSGVFTKVLLDPEYGPSYESCKSPFMYAVKEEGVSGSLFDWFAAHPDRDDNFGRAMIPWAKTTNANAVVRNFIWNDLSPGTSICDVAGGIGSLSLALAQLYPHLRLTVQDLPETLDNAQQLWKEDCPEAITEKRVKFVPLDFFKQTPIVGQDVYFLRNVIHDWPDAEALTILQGVRSAMRPDSRLFIQDMVLQHLHQGTDSREAGALQASLKTAPTPLLPNYGAGNSLAYAMDIYMLAFLNAKERTLEESVVLSAQAGLRLLKVWDFVETCVLEFATAEGVQSNGYH